MTPDSPRDRLWTIPNILTLLRLPLAVLLFVGIAYAWWLPALVLFIVGAFSDWLDGYLARRLNQQSALGRNLDPLIDKVLTGGAFIFLIPTPHSELHPWMVTVVVGRELLITGLRGMMETQGIQFGADWFGKLKTTLQMIALTVIFAVLWLRGISQDGGLIRVLHLVQIILIYAMLLATLGSGVQYVVKAVQRYR